MAQEGAIDLDKRHLEHLKDQKWRLNNLYQIVNDDGELVPFKMRPVQEKLYDEMHYLNIILKARRRGISEFIERFIFDTLNFNNNITACITAQDLDAAKMLLSEKVVYA